MQSSIEQLLINYAPPGLDLQVEDAQGQVVQSGTTDAQGTLIFRSLPPASDYVVATGEGAERKAIGPLAVWATDQVPDNSFYTQQHVVAGYQYITMRDGTQLAINVILPGPIDQGPYPTVIEYSGYDPSNPDSPQPSTLLASTLGYAAVGINIRGTGCSGGSFKFYEAAEDTDGYDAVEIIAQQPWVKFNQVGMVGVSYPAISELFVAQTQPPHLAAIAPLSVISDTARGILYPGGILNNGFATDWTAERQREAEPFGQDYAAKRRDLGDQVCISNQKFRGQNPNLVGLINDNKYYNAAEVDPISPIKFVDKIKVPVFLAGAWQDEQTGGYFPNMLANFTGTNKLHFTITNGGHTDSIGPAIFTRWTEFLSFYVRREIPKLPDAGKLAVGVIAQSVFGVNHVNIEKDRYTDTTDFNTALGRFEAEPKIRILFENGAGSITPGSPIPSFERSFTEWPIASTQPTIWYFDANQHLATQPPAGDGADSYQYDPSLGQLTTYEGGDGGIWTALPNWNWRQPEPGKAAIYETDPLTETLVMAGSGSADLWIKSTATDTDLQVTLTEVRPDAKESYIQSGWLRASHRHVDETQSTILRPVQTHLQVDAAPLPPNELVQARVEIFPFAHVFRAGSRIRLIVNSPGATRPRWKFDVLPAGDTVINTIGRSAAAPSRLVLPVLPGITPPATYPKCPALRLQPCRNYVALTNSPG
ncbi:MAG: CocE/NonD family hydrolase [Deltaproteobacteria bacterium]|nr:CocE/NonD family hydrolase [Deltaproteobacteria bacterium]